MQIVYQIKFANIIMNSFAENGVTGVSILDSRRKKQNGAYPVKYRITFQRKVVYYRSNIDLSTEEWLAVSDPTQKGYNTHQAKRDRKKIDDGLSLIRDHVTEINKLKSFSFEELNNRMGRAVSQNLITVFEQRIESAKREGKINTADWYKYAWNSIASFDSGKISFKSINLTWLQKYEKHLLTSGKSITTISMYLRALKSIMNIGLEQGLITPEDYPFGKKRYKIPTEKTRKLALTIEEIGLIFNYKPKTESEELCRDIWMFSYLCNGANIKDILMLRYSNIEDNEISFYRQKTIRKQDRTKVRAVLLRQMSKIIQRWGTTPKSENFIFPFLTDDMDPVHELRVIKNITSRVNKAMKNIAKNVGIKQSISTYTARHSYATVQKRSGAAISFIAESLGHSDVRTTERYLSIFESATRVKNAENLIKFDQHEDN